MTLEQYLSYEYVKTDLYERQLKIGMLSPYADPFYPKTDNLSREKDEAGKLNEATEKKEVAEKAGDNKSKDTIDKKNIANQPNQV